MSIQTHIENLSTTIAVNSSSTTIVVLTPTAGKFVWVMGMFLQTEADVTITIKSATTAISGPIDFWAASSRERNWHMNGHPIFKTLAASDSFVIGLSSAVQVNGWVSLAEV